MKTNYTPGLRRKNHKLRLADTKRMFNEAFDKVFCKTRPHLRIHCGDPVFSVDRPRPAVVPGKTVKEVAAQYLAMSAPAWGTLKALAARAGLTYSSLANAVSMERRRRQLTEAGRS